MSNAMSLVLPTRGSVGADIWGDALDAATLLIAAHDHTTNKGVQVPSAGIGINADLTFAGFALTNAKGFTFIEQAPASVTSYASMLFASSSDHNLYWRNSSGTNVQITAGNQLNLSAVGGIGGDYAAVSALETFTDATHSYGLFQQIGAGVRQYGKLFTGDVSLYEFKVNGAAGVPSQAVTLKSPTSLAASYPMTFPAAAAAGGAQLLAVDSAGTMTNNGVLGTNVNVQLQGTGYVKRGNRTRSLPFTATAIWNFGSGSLPGYISAGTKAGVALVPGTYFYPVQLEDSNERLQTLTVYMSCTTNPVSLVLYSAGNTSITTIMGSVSGTVNCAAGGISRAIVVTPTSPAVQPAGTVYWIQFGLSGGTNAEVYSMDVTTDVP